VDEAQRAAHSATQAALHAFEAAHPVTKARPAPVQAEARELAARLAQVSYFPLLRI
jgi:hypothetical protein